MGNTPTKYSYLKEKELSIKEKKKREKNLFAEGSKIYLKSEPENGNNFAEIGMVGQSIFQQQIFTISAIPVRVTRLVAFEELTMVLSSAKAQ